MDKKIIINVGRQVCAGGLEIGKLLAEEFNAKYYDRELLNLAAKESGFSEEFFKQSDELRDSFVPSSICLTVITGVLAAISIRTIFRRKVCSSSRAMLSSKQPRKAHASLWGVVPIMCCVISIMWSMCLSRPQLNQGQSSL